MAEPIVRGNFQVGRWFWAFIKRFFLFSLAAIGASRAYSWFFGYDDEVKVWMQQNRPLMFTLLIVSAVVYAVYDLLQEQDR
ncbi:hypothetical protein CU048_01815 [Beijerinckiaceae bacterium]|nr:hypothetical protein CU048_01815 [Beijerinckiaceae bacterium]